MTLNLKVFFPNIFPSVPVLPVVGLNSRKINGAKLHRDSSIVQICLMPSHCLDAPFLCQAQLLGHDSL
jgi:hypothetical protein